MMTPEGIGPLLRHLREQAGRTRERQARLLEEHHGERFSPENLKRWEVEKRVPVPHWHRTLSAVYGISTAEIRKAITATKQNRRLAKIDMHMNEDIQEDDVHRRAFLAAALSVGAAAEPWGRLAAALETGHVDDETAHRLIAATSGMFDSEEHVPARLMFARLTAHLDTLTSLLPNAGPHRTALAIAAGEAAALAGWMSFDLGDHARARHYYGVAKQAGRAAGHGPVCALALGYASYGADPQAAREMLKSASELVRGHGYATAQAWLSAREAEEASKAGDREGAVRALERARTAFDYARPDEEQAWVRFFRPSRLGSMAVSTYARLEHPGLVAAADDALEALGDDDAKIRCSVLGDVADGYLAAGDVERSIDIGSRALAATVQADTTMGRSRLLALAGRLPDSTEAADLRERIRAVM